VVDNTITQRRIAVSVAADRRQRRPQKLQRPRLRPHRFQHQLPQYCHRFRRRHLNRRCHRHLSRRHCRVLGRRLRRRPRRRRYRRHDQLCRTALHVQTAYKHAPCLQNCIAQVQSMVSGFARNAGLRATHAIRSAATTTILAQSGRVAASASSVLYGSHIRFARSPVMCVACSSSTLEANQWKFLISECQRRRQRLTTRSATSRSPAELWAVFLVYY